MRSAAFTAPTRRSWPGVRMPTAASSRAVREPTLGSSCSAAARGVIVFMAVTAKTSKSRAAPKGVFRPGRDVA